MRAVVRLLFEDGGRPLARHRLAMPPKLAIGVFRYQEHYLKQCLRTTYLATLLGPGGENMVPPLYDAVLRYGEGVELTISGLELDDVSRKFTAMSWRLQFIPDEAPSIDSPQV
jgi:hypothetical protein